MAFKNVVIFRLELQGDMSFENLLLDEAYQSPIAINEYKTAELNYVNRNSNGTITGLFVATQKRNIPPAHRPGGEEYSAVSLADGEGLAYPNVILYDPTTAALYLEVNRLGLSNTQIEDYFKLHAANNGVPNLSITLAPILKPNAYDRVNNMLSVMEVEVKIANPVLMLREQNTTGAIHQFAEAAKNINATKDMKLVLKGEEVKGGLIKEEVLRVINVFSHMFNRTEASSSDRYNKLIIKGSRRSSEEEDVEIIDEVINFVLDKIKDRFPLEEQNIASGLQFSERKSGITSVYVRQAETVRSLVGTLD
ncbi:DUF6731 family protein [Bacteroides graminisolvens]|uniref:DUF6731 family protein n=1 Tax=Bacteroides graminisolvens TaxID=477666 RepID=UPI0029C94E02|nr:DUF6731 family protein [Bacteroides graminisolvens]